MGFYIVHNVTVPDAPKSYYFDLPESDEYCGVRTGMLFTDVASSPPQWSKRVKAPENSAALPGMDESQQSQYTYEQINIEGKEGETLKRLFEDFYTDELSSYEAFFDEKYDDIANEVIDQKLTDPFEISQKFWNIDVTDNTPEKLVFVTEDSKEIELPVVTTKVGVSLTQTYPMDTELYGLFWDDGNSKLAITNMAVIFNVTKESMDTLQAYVGTFYDGDLGIEEAESDRADIYISGQCAYCL
ncbi:hypothetical protein [Butyrivibrio sp. INlla16]|uniref:hypothetical protein n=1 Tax=Butyrivibrio sp. INlla16 TaxID=1520807 RepID=UPI000890DDB0|nr:hypothetical protein [Butyrivibrio sp. INlla16]SDB29460.1 hypothetical protein SAMN02910263_01441 [Butyrivibrio sp. INlla16]